MAKQRYGAITNIEESAISALVLTETWLQKEVRIKCDFLKLEDIDTIKQTYSAKVLVRARWKEPLLDNTLPTDDVNFLSLWNPRLEVNNSIGEVKEVLTRSREVKEDEAYVVETRILKGKFTETMELQCFPFDIQDISVQVVSALPLDKVTLKEDQEDLSQVLTQNFVDVSEWQLKHYVKCEDDILTDHNSQNAPFRTRLSFQCCVLRRSYFFIMNFMVIMSMISSLSLVTFALNHSLTPNRCTLSLILVLAGVTFKFAASKNVPQISYLTHLDRYVIGSMLYLATVAVWHALVSRLDEGHATDADSAMFILFCVMWVVLHVIFVGIVFIQGRKRRNKAAAEEMYYLMKTSSVQ